MRILAKTEYGIRALLDLAFHFDGQPVFLKDVAERQQISLSYLEQLISPLISHGMIKTARGKRGGIWLTKLPEEIKLIDAFQILQGPIALVPCLRSPTYCTRSGSCATQDIWSELGESISKVLESSTLKDLKDRQCIKGGKPSAMYYI